MESSALAPTFVNRLEPFEQTFFPPFNEGFRGNCVEISSAASENKSVKVVMDEWTDR